MLFCNAVSSAECCVPGLEMQLRCPVSLCTLCHLLILDTVLSILTAASYQLTPSLLLLVVFPQVLLAFCVRRISTTVILILATTGSARMASTPTRVSAILATWEPSAASRSTSATATLASIRGAASTWSMATSATACWAPQVCKKALDSSM